MAAPTPHQINERMMALWTRRVGLFAGATVLVGVITGIIFWRQLNVMQGQLDEATKQRLMTIAQIRATLQRDNRVDPMGVTLPTGCLLYTSPSPRDRQKSRMPSSA